MVGNSGISSLTRNEVIAIMFRLTLFGAVTYITFKWVASILDPTSKQKTQAKRQAEMLMKKIGVKCDDLSEYELCIASQLVDPLSLSVTWDDIGGLEKTINGIKESIILPMKRQDLFKDSKLLQPPKGVLLHGPPGCGKTMIAKATAKAAGARFINLQMASLADKWYGESQKLAAAVFSLAHKIQPAIIFIDEIDSFLRSRNSQDHECTAMMKAQFLSLWDGLVTEPNYQITIIGASNRPQDVDKAILRRMPATFYIGTPTKEARMNILNIILCEENVHPDVDVRELAEITDGFSGSDLTELCRAAAVYSVKDFIFENNSSHESNAASFDEQQELRPITQHDLTMAAAKMKKDKSFCALQFLTPDMD